jgi:hypothetical protein
MKARIERILALSLTKSAVFVICLGFSLACQSYDEGNRYYLTEKLPSKPVEQVELLYTKPDREFVVIADLQGGSHTPDTLRKRAAGIGGDAVIIVKTGGAIGFDDPKWAGKDSGKSSLSGVVIKYK